MTDAHLFTLQEAARFLRLHPDTVKLYMRRGLLTGRLLGRSWRFSMEDLMAFYGKCPAKQAGAGRKRPFQGNEK